MTTHKLRTASGHNLAEVASALQKSIRRGEVDDAIYWASELDISGFSAYCWRRLRVICSEDVGPADRTLPASIEALYRAFLDLKSPKGKASGAGLQLVHAVILLATSPKSRIVDHALCYHYHAHRAAFREIPDYALDKHTNRGRRKKRGWDHFFEEGALLVSEVGDDPYRELAIEAVKHPEGPFEDPYDRQSKMF